MDFSRDFHEFAAYGRIQLQRLCRLEIAPEEYECLIQAKENEITDRVTAKINAIVDRETSERTKAAFLAGALLGTLCSPPVSTNSGNASERTY